MKPNAMRWHKIADDLARLARDQQGMPEGETAKRKLAEILAKYPEARHYEPVSRLFDDGILTGADLGFILRNNISTEGKWEGDSVREAMEAMQADLLGRIREFKGRPRLGCVNEALTEGKT